MEKIRLNNDTEFQLITNGIISTDEKLTINFLPDRMSLTELEKMFSDVDDTNKILLLSQYNDELRIYIDYSKLIQIGKQIDVEIGQTLVEDVESPVAQNVITVVLQKIDETAKQLETLRSDIDYIAMLSDIEL